MHMSKLPDNTQASFNLLLQQIQQARQKVLAQVNTALIDLYWQVGKTISDKVQSETWGKGVVRELAQYIAQNAPDIKGFSDKNLWRMKQFYETYATDEKLSSLVRALPWTHNTVSAQPCHLIKPNRNWHPLHFLKRIQHGLISPLENPYRHLAKQWFVASGVLSTAPTHLQHIFSATV